MSVRDQLADVIIAADLAECQPVVNGGAGPQLSELYQVDERLLLQIIAVAVYWRERHKRRLLLTCITRHTGRATDQHDLANCPRGVRAVDASSRGWAIEEIEEAAAWGRHTFRYPGHDPIYYHNSGQGAHFHIQVRP